MACVDLQQMKYRLGHNPLRSGAAAAMDLERRHGCTLVAQKLAWRSTVSLEALRVLF
jgi:hypothetical protein